MTDRYTDNLRELLAIIVIALSVSALCYYCYYQLTPWIWSQNIPYKPEDLTPRVLEASIEHDGIEIYALYLMVFVIGSISLFMYGLLGRIPVTTGRQLFLVLCTVVSCGYCFTIGFKPPMSNYHELPIMTIVQKSQFPILITTLFLAGMAYLQTRSPRTVMVISAIILVPICFTATEPISRYDNSFIFSPALRLINGAALRDIYFQYDLLPSLLAAAWMKLGLDLNWFQVLGQMAYFLAIFGVFFFSGRLFRTKELSLLLVVALVLLRIYASPWDIVYCFQVTPLRLDLWLMLLAVVYWRGPYHWSSGLVCGLLILLLKNFGIIYTLVYIQLLITLYVIEHLDGGRRAALLRDLPEYGKRCARPLAIIIAAFIASHFLFYNPEYPNYSGYYQKLGIGFIQISPTSFYWYIPAMISIVILLLFRLRNSVSSTCLICGFLLVYCAIGNSIYFFGRSHEHNILNISIVLLFLCFFMLDLVSQLLQEESKFDGSFSSLRRHVSVIAASILVLAIIIFYADAIANKSTIQATRIARGQMIFPKEYDQTVFSGVLNKTRELTNNSNKVYFVGGQDFELYYYGQYAPVGYCNPFTTWIFTKDLVSFLQGLLDNGYYLVCSSKMKYLLEKLHYNTAKELGLSVVVAKLPLLEARP